MMYRFFSFRAALKVLLFFLIGGCSPQENSITEIDRALLQPVMYGDIFSSTASSYSNYILHYQHVSKQLWVFKNSNTKMFLNQKISLPDTINSLVFWEFGRDTNEIIFGANYAHLQGTAIYWMNWTSDSITNVSYIDSVFMSGPLSTRTQYHLYILAHANSELHMDPYERALRYNEKLWLYKINLSSRKISLTDSASFYGINNIKSIHFRDDELETFSGYLEKSLNELDNPKDAYLLKYKQFLLEGLLPSEAGYQARLQTTEYSKRIFTEKYQIFGIKKGLRTSFNSQGMRYTLADRKSAISLIDDQNIKSTFNTHPYYFLPFADEDYIYLDNNDTVFRCSIHKLLPGG
jgi:hypothetical protein